MRNEPQDLDVLPWELQRGQGENPRHFAVFLAYLHARPRSLREACRIAWKTDKPESVPGHIQRASVRFRWTERAALWDVHIAEQERAAFERTRLAARARRIRQLDTLAGLFDARLAKMSEKDLKRMQPRHVVQELVRVHDSEREELLDTSEHRHGEDRADHGLQSIDDVVKPPSDHDHE